MKRFRIFEDSAPFSLVIKQSVQENTSSEQQPFHRGPRFHIGCRGLGRFQPLEPRNKVRGVSPYSHDGLMEGGTGIKVLWYREYNTTNTALRKTIRPKPLPTKCLLPGEILSKLRVAMERKGPKHVRQKQHRTGNVLALSSPFVNGET